MTPLFLFVRRAALSVHEYSSLRYSLNGLFTQFRMSRRVFIEFYFDVLSPYAWIGFEVVTPFLAIFKVDDFFFGKYRLCHAINRCGMSMWDGVHSSWAVSSKTRVPFILLFSVNCYRSDRDYIVIPIGNMGIMLQAAAKKKFFFVDLAHLAKYYGIPLAQPKVWKSGGQHWLRRDWYWKYRTPTKRWSSMAPCALSVSLQFWTWIIVRWCNQLHENFGCEDIRAIKIFTSMRIL